MLIFERERYFNYVDNLFDDEIIFDALMRIKNQPADFNSDAWNDDLTNSKHSKTIKIWSHKNFSESLKSIISINIIQKFPELNTKDITLEFQLTEWKEGSYITFHGDRHVEFALTCYLDDECEGGLFCYKNFKNDTRGFFLLPVKNRCIIIKRLSHSVTPVIKGIRTTLQIWGSRNAVL